MSDSESSGLGMSGSDLALALSSSPKPCKTCGSNVYGLDHDGGCPLRLGGLTVVGYGGILEVVWTGALPDQFGGHTIGELLAPYDKPRRF